MKKVRVFAAVCIAATVLAASFVSADAGEWPPRRLTLVWHSSAGSAGDIMMRAIGKFIEKKHGVTVVVENRTGASGANAWNSVARGRPDGSVVLGVSSTFIASPLQNNMNVNYTSMDPIAMLFTDAICFFVAADSPYKTLDDFFAEAKKRPGELSITGGTAGNVEFIAARELLAEAGADVALVPFDGGSEGVVSVLGGHVSAGVGEYSEARAVIESGKLRVLAMFNAVPGVDYPSLADLGYKTTVNKLRGIVVTKGTPQPIKDAIFATLKEMMDDPDFQTYYRQNTLAPTFHPADEFYKIMEEQTEAVKQALAGLK